MQAESDDKSIDQSAKNTDQQRIVCDRIARYDIGQDTCQHDHQTGIHCEFFTNESKTDIHRYRIEQYIDNGIWNCNM